MCDGNILISVFLDICSPTSLSLYSTLILQVFIIFCVLFVQLCILYSPGGEGHGRESRIETK